MSLKMHLHAIIKGNWRYTWRQGSSELRDALQDCDQACLEVHLVGMIMRTWRW